MAATNLIVTGDLHTGKSTLVRSVLECLSISYLGILSMPIIRGAQRVGFALRHVGESHIDIFAHEDFQSATHYDRYFVKDEPFQRAAEYLMACLKCDVQLIVVDELGVMENHIAVYLKAVKAVLDSATNSLMVVQKRAREMWHILEPRDDVIVFTVQANNHIALHREILQRLEEETKAESAIQAKISSRR